MRHAIANITRLLMESQRMLRNIYDLSHKALRRSVATLDAHPHGRRLDASETGGHDLLIEPDY